MGSAAIQLAKRRGAHVSAVTTLAKADAVRAIGADDIYDRHQDLVAQTGENIFDLVVDNVAGDDFPYLLKSLKRGGRYTSSGAIAGPIVSLDMRDMYLKDITLIGTTAWDQAVFPDIKPSRQAPFALYWQKPMRSKILLRRKKNFLEKSLSVILCYCLKMLA